MERESSGTKNLKPIGAFGFSDLQGSVPIDYQQNTHPYRSFMVYPQQLQEYFPVMVTNMQQPEQPEPSARGIDGLNIVQEGVDGNHEGKEKTEFPWQRVKWTDEMVKLLITAVSFMEEEASFDCTGAGIKRFSLRNGKWRYISKALAERSCIVSPQQCEDKFNDLKKRYRRLNEIIGRDNCCMVVEDPTLLDMLDLSDSAKEAVRKILCSKQLFYREMCSYHNGNLLYLPRDQALHRSLQLAIKTKDNNDPQESRQHLSEALVEDAQVVASVGRDDETAKPISLKCSQEMFVFPVVSEKKRKHGEEHETVGFKKTVNFMDCSNKSDPHSSNASTNLNKKFAEGSQVEWIQNQLIMSRSLQLEEQKLRIQAQMLELEKQRFRWHMFCEQEDKVLLKMRLHNEYMKLENEHLALEIKRR